MKRKVVLLRGLPASGKSTWAKKTVDYNPGKYKRVNKDDLRAMIDNGQWSKENEKFVLSMRDALILQAIENGYDVIVDDTNLADKHINHITQLVHGKAEVVVEDFTHVPLHECIKRDLARPNSVGEDVIVRMYRQFLEPQKKLWQENTTLPKAYLFDVDGTLALKGDRSPFDFSRVGEDIVNEPVAQVARHLAKYPIIIFSGRDDSCLEATKDWLQLNQIPFDLLVMRKTGDRRSDDIVKREMYMEHVHDKYSIQMVFDDRPRVIRMWRALGLLVADCGPNYEF